MEIQSEIEIKIRSITSNNDQKKLNAKEKERMEFTINTYDKYKSNQIDIIQFLSHVGPRYTYTKVKIKPACPKKDIPQCQRCQVYG